MATRALLRHVRISPRKMRLAADMVRGMTVDEADATLALLPNKAAHILRKVTRSAAANAENNENLNRDELYVKTILIDKGPVMKRMRPRARGRSDIRQVRLTHVTVEVEEISARADRRGAR